MDIRTEFARGLEAYQAKNFDQAREQFQKVLAEKPDDVNAYLNLALTNNELKEPYKALAHLRAAEEIGGRTKASKSVAQNLQSTSGRNLGAETQNFSFLQALNQSFLLDVSLWSLSALSSVLILASLWLWIVQKIKNRTSYLFPVLFSCLAVVFITLSCCKLILQNERRGTVIEKDSPLYVEADASSPQLLNVPVGQYILIKEKKNDWYRIEIDGVGEGYMKADQIFTRKEAL